MRNENDFLGINTYTCIYLRKRRHGSPAFGCALVWDMYTYTQININIYTYMYNVHSLSMQEDKKKKIKRQ